MRRMKFGILTFLTVLVFCNLPALPAEEKGDITLPKPEIKGGKPLMEALSERKTTREFAGKELSLQQLSNLLWAAFGINRVDYGMRTAPSALNWQEVDIYVVLKGGTYVYDAKKNVLTRVLSEDIRALTGKQAVVADAPVNLVYVADLSKTRRADEKTRDLFIYADTGCISQNVYLFCASEGLNTFVRAYIDKEALARKLGLRDDQMIVLAQSVGYPPEK